MSPTNFNEIPEDTFINISSFQDYRDLARLSLTNRFFYTSQVLKQAMHYKLIKDFNFPANMASANALTTDYHNLSFDLFFRALAKEMQIFLKKETDGNLSEQDFIADLQKKASFVRDIPRVNSLIELIASQGYALLFHVALIKARKSLQPKQLQDLACQLLYLITANPTKPAGRFEIARLVLPLVKSKIDNNLAPINDKGERCLRGTPLLNAVINQDPEMVQLLLDHDAKHDITCIITDSNKDQYFITPAEYAQRNGNREIRELLGIPRIAHSCNIQ